MISTPLFSTNMFKVQLSQNTTGADRGTPAETGTVAGYGVKRPGQTLAPSAKDWMRQFSKLHQITPLALGITQTRALRRLNDSMLYGTPTRF